MSDIPAEFPQIDLREQLARIDRAMAEGEMFRAETRKFVAEAIKLQRDHTLAPWQIVIGSFAAGAGMFAALFALLKLRLG